LTTREPTGISTLDLMIEGGVPRGSLILVAGNPGSGKTVFCAHFLHHGAEKLGETGIYVSFSEARDTFLTEMKGFGFDFEKLQNEGKFRFLDFPAMGEHGVETTVEVILKHMRETKAQRLVIDSFSAMAQAFRNRNDARIILHTILSKMTRQAGCTTFLITEVPTGDNRLGISMEEFVADGVLILKREKEFGIRELEIQKMRGTRVPQFHQMFTLDGGFQLIASFSMPKPTTTATWEPIPDSDTHFSTGSRDLDRMLDGGYRRGAYVLLEAEPSVPLEATQLVSFSTAWNFLSKRRGVFILPSSGIVQEEYRRSLSPYVGDAYDKCVTVYSAAKPDKSGAEPWRQPQVELRKRTGGSLLTMIGYDLLESNYADHLDELFNLLGHSIMECKLQGELALAIAGPGLEVTRRAVYLSDYHLRLIERNGSVFLHGVKPRTPPYALICDVSRGYPAAALKPSI